MSIRIERTDDTVRAILDRPEAMNAINFDVMDRLEELLAELEENSRVRLFILTGSGKSFISGGDLREFHTITDARGARKMSVRMVQILRRIEALPFWTLAAVNGPAYGGGWEILLSFDFAVATQSATFGFTQGRFYLPPGWGGLTRLTDVVGKKRAHYWLASQKVISSKTALNSGLIQDLFEDERFDEAIVSLSRRFTMNDRNFIKALKDKRIDSISDELEPFSRFWESDEHMSRVEQFLNDKNTGNGS